MKAIKLMLVSSLVVCFSTTNAAASDESSNAKIQRAMKAAPSSISAGAEIRDVTGWTAEDGWPILRDREVGNTWTCFPGVPLNPGDKHPMCNDQVWMNWLNAAADVMYGGQPWVFTTNTVGFSYMLRGDALVNNNDATGTVSFGTLDQEGPHLMMLFPSVEEVADLYLEPNAGGPYVMWGDVTAPFGNALIHVMIPLTDRDR
ncbi:MAG: hypothetical protein OEM03_09165 [Chromatiales bacterium]|nr:hypothetical protein [Chromatiales bacterium]